MSDGSPPLTVSLGDGIAARVLPGGGEKVLWFHGYTLDSSSWEELWGLLPGWHHIGLDLPGHGASRADAFGPDLPAVAARVGELALAHGVRHLVALSFGTIIALQVAIQFPDSFDTLVLGAPALGGGPQDHEVERRYEELMRLYGERGPGPHMRDLWMSSPPNLFKGAEAQPALWQRLRAIVGRHSWGELEDHAMSAFGNFPQKESEVRKIRAATLLLLGEDELPAFKRCAELIRRSVPRGRRIYLPAVGHLCMLEAAATVAPLIDTHLRTRGGARQTS